MQTASNRAPYQRETASHIGHGPRQKVFANHMRPAASEGNFGRQRKSTSESDSESAHSYSLSSSCEDNESPPPVARSGSYGRQKPQSTNRAYESSRRGAAHDGYGHHNENRRYPTNSYRDVALDELAREEDSASESSLIQRLSEIATQEHGNLPSVKKQTPMSKRTNYPPTFEGRNMTAQDFIATYARHIRAAENQYSDAGTGLVTHTTQRSHRLEDSESEREAESAELPILMPVTQDRVAAGQGWERHAPSSQNQAPQSRIRAARQPGATDLNKQPTNRTAEPPEPTPIEDAPMTGPAVPASGGGGRRRFVRQARESIQRSRAVTPHMMSINQQISVVAIWMTWPKNKNMFVF